jgi:hypothetical protein
VKDAQRSTVAAQMLLNPVAGNEAVFQAAWFKSYDLRPTILNVYILRPLALEGDMAALRLCLERVLPPRRDARP